MPRETTIHLTSAFIPSSRQPRKNGRILCPVILTSVSSCATVSGVVIGEWILFVLLIEWVLDRQPIGVLRSSSMVVQGCDHSVPLWLVVQVLVVWRIFSRPSWAIDCCVWRMEGAARRGSLLGEFERRRSGRRGPQELYHWWVQRDGFRERVAAAQLFGVGRGYANTGHACSRRKSLKTLFWQLFDGVSLEITTSITEK